MQNLRKPTRKTQRVHQAPLETHLGTGGESSFDLAAFLLTQRHMIEPTVDQFMTKGPYTIGHDQTLAAAHRKMREHSIRHLPVLAAGKLVGIVSQRDLHFIETLNEVDPEEVQVSEAMSEGAYTIGPRATVRKVATEMAEQKYGCAVVMDKEHIVGVFTTVDALKALSSLLDEQRQVRATSRS
jgi:acetoin utilization protein AcuB